MNSAVDPPNLSLEADDLVDWLELSALFNEYRVARLDALLGSLDQLEETSEDDIGERDRQKEQLIELVENEVVLRQRSLDNAYPFTLSGSGEELICHDGWRDVRYSFYIICLITTHVSGSTILRAPPVNGLLTRLRNQIFQLVATLGLAGLANGPALSVGWPRTSNERIVQLLDRAAAAGAGFSVRNPIGQYVSPHEKDGGIDVIAWTPEVIPPPTAFYFAQSASGKNWPNKSASDHSRTFAQAYMQDHMTGNRSCITVIPYRVMNDAFWNSQHQHHRAILDRLRLPLRALQGLRIAEGGVMVDNAGDVGAISLWISDYLAYAIAA